MADDAPDPPDDAPEPAEAELVAYLDGELDAAAARRVEARIASDPKLRARAEALKRSYDLLDFLPKPEPSAAFASRTLDKLPAVKSSPAAPTVAPPVPQPSGTGTLILAPVPPRTGAWALALVLLVAAFLGLGYLGSAAARTYLFPHPTTPDVTAATLPLTDLRVVERLALYAPADDLDFVEKLAAPDRFGDDAATPVAGPVEPDKPDGKELDALVTAFRDLPAERQDKLRLLDQQLHALPDARRDTLLRVLEVYAAWLQRLTDAERKKILSVSSADDRLEAIDDARRALWVSGLPAEQRRQLKALSVDDRAKLIVKWKADEDASRDRWNAARFHFEFTLSGQQPWPFDDEGLRKQVLSFAHSAYHPNDAKRNRLQPPDLIRFNEALERGEKGGQWTWLGKALYDFSRSPKYEMLPEAGPGGKMVTDLADLSLPLPENMLKRFGPKGAGDLVGRWPDFALALHKALGTTKFGGKERDLRLGPARPGEFKPEVEQFLPVLQKTVSPTEWTGLADKAGRWPEYPVELLRLARAHDLSVPGAMPPGPPSRWEKTYSLPPRPVPRPGSE